VCGGGGGGTGGLLGFCALHSVRLKDRSSCAVSISKLCTSFASPVSRMLHRGSITQQDKVTQQSNTTK